MPRNYATLDLAPAGRPLERSPFAPLVTCVSGQSRSRITITSPRFPVHKFRTQASIASRDAPARTVRIMHPLHPFVLSCNFCNHHVCVCGGRKKQCNAINHGAGGVLRSTTCQVAEPCGGERAKPNAGRRTETQRSAGSRQPAAGKDDERARARRPGQQRHV